MECHEIEELLHFYLADELTLSEKLEVQEHLDACAACRASLDLERQITRNLRVLRDGQSAPPPLRSRLAALLDVELSVRKEHRAPGRVWGRRRGLAFAAIVMLALSALVVALEWRSSDPTSLVRHVVAEHRALLSSKTVPDVIAADAAFVRAKLQEQLDFSFGLPRFLNLRATTLGGRVCFVTSAKGAHVLYDIEGHLVSYYVLKPPGVSLSGFTRTVIDGRVVFVASQDGVQVLLWREGEVYCALVADFPLSRLLALAQSVLRSGLA